jgi:hypothetical protein
MNGQVTNRTARRAGRRWVGGLAGHVRSGWTSVRQDEKRRLVVHLRGLLAALFPSAGAGASPPVQRQLTSMTLSWSSGSHQPVKSPRQPMNTSGSQYKAAYRGNDRPKPSQFFGRQSPRQRAKWQRLTMTHRSRRYTLAGGYERQIDSLSLSDGASKRASVVRNTTTNPERYQVDSSAKASQVWATGSASIASLT